MDDVELPAANESVEDARGTRILPRPHGANHRHRQDRDAGLAQVRYE